MTRTDIVSMCQKHNIALEVDLLFDRICTGDATMSQAWGPLVRGLRFRHPSITGLAEKYNKQPAQVLLRYSIQKVRRLAALASARLTRCTQDFIPIPKASSKERIAANTEIYDFELTKEEIAHLDSLDEGSSVYPYRNEGLSR